MSPNGHHDPTLPTLLRRAARTGFGLLQNRSELFVVEVQEEKLRLVTLLISCLGAMTLGMTTLLLLTGIVVFLVPEEYRAYVAAAFALVYLLGTIAAVFAVKAMLGRTPFAETLGQFNKDCDLLERLE